MRSTKIYKLTRSEKLAISQFASSVVKTMHGKFTKKEKESIRSFSEERFNAIRGIRSLHINFNPEQEEHIRACIYNCIVNAYFAGLSSPNRKFRPKFPNIYKKEIK